jgi:hypothetical protein
VFAFGSLMVAEESVRVRGKMSPEMAVQVLRVLRATLSNCGEVLKLRLPSQKGNFLMARVMTSGMVKTTEDVTMDNPQPSPKLAVKCRHGCSSQTIR